MLLMGFTRNVRTLMLLMGFTRNARTPMLLMGCTRNAKILRLPRYAGERTATG